MCLLRMSYGPTRAIRRLLSTTSLRTSVGIGPPSWRRRVRPDRTTKAASTSSCRLHAHYLQRHTNEESDVPINSSLRPKRFLGDHMDITRKSQGDHNHTEITRRSQHCQFLSASSLLQHLTHTHNTNITGRSHPRSSHADNTNITGKSHTHSICYCGRVMSKWMKGCVEGGCECEGNTQGSVGRLL
jgi:hypothetical protein